MKIALVVAQFNREITALMEEAAVAHARKKGSVIAQIIYVPGAFDAPLAVKKLAARNEIDAVAVLGAIIKGDTMHDEIIGHALAQTLMTIALEYDKPVTNGVIGPDATYDQAAERAREYGMRAVDAAIMMCDI